MNGPFINTNATRRVDRLIKELNGKTTRRKNKHKTRRTPPYPFQPRTDEQ